jgi:hypothetical protein
MLMGRLSNLEPVLSAEIITNWPGRAEDARVSVFNTIKLTEGITRRLAKMTADSSCTDISRSEYFT